jgi:hypothetical protein
MYGVMSQRRRLRRRRRTSVETIAEPESEASMIE